MSGGGDSGSKQLRQQQQQNQQRIQQGMTQINSVFGGGTYGVNPVTSYDPKGSYFTATGSPYKFDPNDVGFTNWLATNPGAKFIGGRAAGEAGNTAPTSAQRQAQQAAAYEKYLAQSGGLYTGTAKSGGFNDAFYNQRKQDQLNVQQPQLGQQYAQTQKGLAFQLANKGLLRSSTATNLGQSLKNEFGQQNQNLDQAAQQSANQLRSTVEGQRQQIVGQLEASADPAAALQLATGAATSLNAPSTFAPLANLFSNWQNLYLANQVGQQGQQQQMFNPYIMFGNQGVNNPLGSGSSRTVS